MASSKRNALKFWETRGRKVNESVKRDLAPETHCGNSEGLLIFFNGSDESLKRGAVVVLDAFTFGPHVPRCVGSGASWCILGLRCVNAEQYFMLDFDSRFVNPTDEQSRVVGEHEEAPLVENRRP